MSTRPSCSRTLLAFGCILTAACTDGEPSFSPVDPVVPAAEVVDMADGRIAFVSDMDGNHEIYVMNADGSGVVRLTDDDRADYRPAWSPDGSRIVFMRFAADWSWLSIWVMNADGSDQQELHPGYGLCPAWSPDGTQIAFQGWTEATGLDLMIIDADGSNVVNLTNTPEYEGCPDWSPDGSRLVFPATNYGADPQVDQHVSALPDVDLYVMNRDGSGRTRLLAHPGHEFDPDWSPDGRQVLFSHLPVGWGSRPTASGLWIVSADGTGLRRLLNPVAAEVNADWSPDGSRIAVAVLGSDYEIYTANVDGSGLVRLTYRHKVYDAQPSWSP